MPPLGAPLVTQGPAAVGRLGRQYFEADLPHVYENPGKVEALIYLVITYT